MLDQLYRLTPMEDSFGINNVALVDGQPRTLGLKTCCRSTSTTASTSSGGGREYRRRKAQERLHLVEGLLIALVDIDEVIQIIRGSDDTAQARERLMEVFDLTEMQANYILDMPLRRLTKFPGIELETERDELHATIDELTALLDDEDALRKLVSDELAEVAKQFGTPRRTVLLESAGQPTPRQRHCRSRSATTRAGSCCPPPGCWRAPRTPSRCLPRAKRAKHDVIVRRGRDDRARRGRPGHLDAGGGPAVGRSTCRRCRTPRPRRRWPVARRFASSSTWTASRPSA